MNTFIVSDRNVRVRFLIVKVGRATRVILQGRPEGAKHLHGTFRVLDLKAARTEWANLQARGFRTVTAN